GRDVEDELLAGLGVEGEVVGVAALVERPPEADRHGRRRGGRRRRRVVRLLLRHLRQVVDNDVERRAAAGGGERDAVRARREIRRGRDLNPRLATGRRGLREQLRRKFRVAGLRLLQFREVFP